MWHAWRTFLLATIPIMALVDPPGALGDLTVTGGFGPNGDIGFVTSPPNLSVSFGGDSQGSLYQMDGFVNSPGADLGAGTGMSADLANGAPTGIGYTFNASQPTVDQLLLSYTFVNNTGAALTDFQFLHFVDPDIGPNFADEWATVNGGSNLGYNQNPSSFQIGDPTFSTVFTNLGAGALSNGSDFPNSSQTGDVSVGIGFMVGTLAIGKSVTFDVLLSDDGTSMGSFSVTQHDPIYIGDTLTISGAVVPEPSSLILLSVGSLMGVAPLAWRRFRAQA